MIPKGVYEEKAAITAGATLANAEQIQAWDGIEGQTWTSWDSHFNRAVASYDSHLMAAAAIGDRDRVLDVGCGTGLSTRAAARAARGGFALGVDLSHEMLARASAVASDSGLGNIEFLCADAQVHPFETGSIDVVISRFGAMFFDDQAAAFGNLARPLRPGGRLTLLAWQPLAANPWIQVIRDALAVGRTLPEPPVGAPGPFGLAEPDATARVLKHAGFTDLAVASLSEPVWYGTDPHDALTYVRSMSFSRGLLAGLDETDTATGLANLHAAFADANGDDGVTFAGSAWLISAVRAD